MQRIWIIAVAATLGAGCDEHAEPAASAPVPAPSAAAPAPPPARPSAGPSVDDTTFALAMERTSEGTLSLTLEGRGGYHVNADFPFAADFSDSSPGVKLSKTSLSKTDATTFSEQGAVFELPLQVQGEDQEVKARVRFAVCTEETCVPESRTLVLPVSP